MESKMEMIWASMQSFVEKTRFKPNTILMGSGTYYLVKLGGVDFPTYVRYDRNEIILFGLRVVHVPDMKETEYKMAFLAEN